MSDELKARDNAISVLERLKADVPYYMGTQPKAVHYQTIHAGLDTALEALRGASGGEAGVADPVNYKAWANNMIAFIRERDLQVAFTDWCGGWPYPGKPTPAAATVGAVEPAEAMIDAGVAFALQVSLGGEYR